MRSLLAFLGVLLAAGAALAQANVRLHTQPKTPPKDVLDKLGLKQAWHIKVPLDGLRDGFYSLQLVHGPTFPLLLAQTYQGAVVAINADTGDTLWRTTVGMPYQIAAPAGWNSQAIFVSRKANLYVLDRDTGKHQLYTADPVSNLPIYGMPLEGVPSAGLVADEVFLFVCFTDRAIRYFVPNYRTAFKQREREALSGKKLIDSPQVIRQWSFNTYGGQLLKTPVLSGETLALMSSDGTVLMVNKLAGMPERAVSRFTTEGPIVAPVAFNQSTAYVPCTDYFLYALDVTSGRLPWRFGGQAPIVHKPEATDNDVFVTPNKGGLHRLHRNNGQVMWGNKDAFQFLATNERFVYAFDTHNKMLVLDYERGNELARYDMRDWVLPIANDVTDRIYLASHDGQILCLHHRDFVKPLKVKTFEGKILPQEKDKGIVPPEEKDLQDKKLPKDDKMSGAPAWRYPMRGTAEPRSSGLRAKDVPAACDDDRRLLAPDGYTLL